VPALLSRPQEAVVVPSGADHAPAIHGVTPRQQKINIIGSLRKHLKLALIGAFLILVVGFPLAWKLGTPKYSATAVVFVSPRFIANLDDGSNQKFDSATQYREYVLQNVKTINRFDIVLDALKRTSPSFWVRPGESFERAANRLQGALVLEEVPDTYQITITLESTKKAGLAEVVNSVTNSYLEKAKSEEFYGSDQRVKKLIDDQKRIQTEINEKQAQRLALAQTLGVSSFTDNYLNPYDRLLITAKEAQSEAQTEAIQAEAQLSAVDESQRSGAGDALHAYASAEASKDPALTTMMSDLNGRRAQLLASSSGLSPEHPGRRAADRELAEIDKERQSAYQKVVDSFSRMLLEQRRADAFKARQVAKELTAEAMNQASKAAEFTRGYQEGIQLGLDVDRARKGYDTVQQRIDYFLIEKDAPGFVRLFSAARTPDQAAKGGRKKFLGIILTLAFLFALLTPAGIDYLDPRLHSPGDVEDLLGFAPLSWLMDKEDAGSEFEHEQILRLANRISQDQQNNGSRIFAFTSVKSGGGTSTIVMDAARALGSLGVAALAVEANAYRADPRYRKPPSRGLTVLLTGNRSLHSAIIPADDQGPDRIPVGDLANEKNLPDIQNLTDVLREAAAAYTVVLVDIPPILVSVDAEFIARYADVVVLVVESGSVTKAELLRATRSLERIHIPAVSVLVNRVRRNERTGLARSARCEFQLGAAKPRSRWISPWTWG